ncbi:hypothetical protein LDC_0730, partial [sediment metagenome]
TNRSGPGNIIPVAVQTISAAQFPERHIFHAAQLFYCAMNGRFESKMRRSGRTAREAHYSY